MSMQAEHYGENKPRVLMIVRKYYPWIGGTERQAQKLSAKLIELGMSIQVVTGWWKSGTARRETIETVPVFRNFTAWEFFGIKGLRKFSGHLYIASLYYYLWKHRHEYDLIHVHLLNYHAFPAVLAAHHFGKKIIIKIANSGQGSDIRKMQANHMIPGEKQMLPTALQADCMVAINSTIIDELQAAGVPEERIVVIPNGVETGGIPEKTDYRLNRTITVIFVGRLHPQKGLDILLSAFKEASSQRPHLVWRLWILGEGSLYAELTAEVKRLELDEMVKFHGQVDSVSAYLAKADIFVLPSRSEGMSNALLEAMTHGLPSIATNISGNTDLIQDGKNGLLVEPDDPKDLTEKLIRLADNDQLREHVGRAARRTIEVTYDIEHVADQYRQLYQALLTGSDQPIAKVVDQGI